MNATPENSKKTKLLLIVFLGLFALVALPIVAMIVLGFSKGAFSP